MIVLRGLGRNGGRASGLVLFGFSFAPLATLRRIKNVFVVAETLRNYLQSGARRVEIVSAPSVIYAQSQEVMQTALRLDDLDLHLTVKRQDTVLAYQDFPIYVSQPRSDVFVTSKGVKV